ncbi:hypothetical protein PAXRUDRAFT_20422 [Paxillus rubicundulus Ve08.2h10]|uniref:Uncharacterized protein n=1 Tax=Paxillus rubicundulus Ve08.2h10 TaxID=930991 RepID=A0A0D0CEB6_9AGAM|nr:hypothetical protein PAXRUDRAFT_20422 [Paxillus rubicundulus Ve08.2h10]
MSVTAEGAYSPVSTSSSGLCSCYYEVTVALRNQPASAGHHVQSTTKRAAQLSPLTKPLSKPSLACRKEPELLSETGVLLHKFPYLSEVAELLRSVKFMKVIQYLTGGKDGGDETDTMVKIFDQMSLREYQVITQIMESNVRAKKLRFMHIAFEGILIVEFPRSAHEIPLSELRGALAPLIEQIPYYDMLVHPLVEMNLSLRSSSGDFNAPPDLSICLAHLSGRRLKPTFICIGECTFSQDKETLLKKLQLKVDARSEIMMVVMIILTETSPYCSFKEDLTAWHTSRHHSKCSSFKEFLDMIETIDEDSKWLGPITVANHTWCHISNVNYHVWVKDGEEKINISTQSTRTVAAHGTLFLKIDMDTVDIVFHQGLLKFRDTMIQFSKRLDPKADTSLLSAMDILWDFNWNLTLLKDPTSHSL